MPAIAVAAGGLTLVSLAKPVPFPGAGRVGTEDNRYLADNPSPVGKGDAAYFRSPQGGDVEAKRG